MSKKHPVGVPDAENPEWTDADYRAARPFAEVFPDLAAQIVARRRGPQKAPRKQMVSMRLDADVLEKFRATGKGWQSRINDTLAAHAPRRSRKAATARRDRPVRKRREAL